MAKITLQFNQDGNFSLERIQFGHPLLERDRISVRGKGSAAMGAYGSFQWSSAVQGLCLLLLRAKLRAVSKLVTTSAETESVGVSNNSNIQGGAHTLAASLDYAISKQPIWLRELFGVDKYGTSLIRRLVHRHNPERKRPGDTIIGINAEQLHSEDISVVVGMVKVEDTEALSKLVEWIESQKSKVIKVAAKDSVSRPKSQLRARSLRRGTVLPASDFERLSAMKAA